MAARQSRTRTGCWTCKQRKKKCDETKPDCLACISLGVTCQGYGVRLSWDNGIATRGKFTGATAPTELLEQFPKRKLRNRVRRDSQKDDSASATGILTCVNAGVGVDEGGEPLLSLDKPPFTATFSPSLSDLIPFYEGSKSPPESMNTGEIDWSTFAVGSSTEMELLRDFFTIGHLTLYSSDNDASPIRRDLIPLCRESSALRMTCIAYQSILSKGPHEESLNYYGSALENFRQDLASPVASYYDSTLATGILLCSIGISQGFSWSFHIPAMEKLITLYTPSQYTKFRRHALEVLAYFDLPTLVINRQHKSLGLWKKYCSGLCDSDCDEIELCSGLPKSFLDIMSCIEDSDAEDRFERWPGHVGELLQYHLWNAYRYAGMLKSRELQRTKRMVEHNMNNGSSTIDDLAFDPNGSRINITSCRPSNTILVNGIIASLNAIQQAGPERTLVMNAVLWPLATAAVQVDILDLHPDWRKVVDTLLEKLCEESNPQVDGFRVILDILRTGGGATADAVAQQMNLEVALV